MKTHKKGVVTRIRTKSNNKKGVGITNAPKGWVGHEAEHCKMHKKGVCVCVAIQNRIQCTKEGVRSRIRTEKNTQNGCRCRDKGCGGRDSEQKKNMYKKDRGRESEQK